MKQTAVDFLWENLKHINSLQNRDEISEGNANVMRVNCILQARKMEKEQMVNAFEESRITHPMIGFKHETFKEYYNETFKTNEK